MTPYFEFVHRVLWFLIFLVSVFPNPLSWFDRFVVPYLSSMFLGFIVIILFRVIIVFSMFLFAYLVFKQVVDYNIWGLRWKVFRKK